jgi:hypothetical protein
LIVFSHLKRNNFVTYYAGKLLINGTWLVRIGRFLEQSAYHGLITECGEELIRVTGDSLDSLRWIF